MLRSRLGLVLVVLVLAVRVESAEDPALARRLAGLDVYMEKVVKDWNGPGVGVGIVVKDRLVYAKGFGYRDHGQKLPFTSKTTQPIASNTKLFTALAAGLLVEDGKLEWDKPPATIRSGTSRTSRARSCSSGSSTSSRRSPCARLSSTRT